MNKKSRTIALLVLTVALMGLAGAVAAAAWASPPVYKECIPCTTNKDCGFPKTNLICRENGACSSSPFVLCD